MTRFLLPIAIAPAPWSGTHARTSLRRAQLPNLACASRTPSTQGLVTQWKCTLDGETAFTIDRATADSSRIAPCGSTGIASGADARFVACQL